MNKSIKVTIINGQNHKGSTYMLGRLLAEKITNIDSINEFFLPKDFDNFCVGCTNCFMKSETLCPHYSKLKPLTDAMLEADVLIFTSPVYVYHCTGSMKAFLDHYGYWWIVHRPNEKMFSKQAVCLSTAAGAGMKSTNKDIKDSMFYWGVGKTYTYGLAVRAVSWNDVSLTRKNRAEKNLNRIAAKIKSKHGKVRPSLKTKAFFNIMRHANKKGWNPADTEYWKSKNWINNARPWKL